MLIFDGHCDSILLSLKNNQSLNQIIPERQFDFIKGLGSVNIQQMALFIEEDYMDNQPFSRVNQLINKIDQDIKANNNVCLLTTGKSLETLNSNQLGIILAIEGCAYALDNNLEHINFFFNRGVRSMSLTWNYDNALATGCFTNEQHKGLSEMGEAVVKRMNQLGMVLDVSHLSEKSFWDCMMNTNQSVIASHSCSKSICFHPRNLTDQQVKAIAEIDGVIGINFFPVFLLEDATMQRNASIEDVIFHLKHIKKIVGSRFLGLGSDFDGISFSPKGLNDIRDLKTIPDYLVKAGFSVDEIEGIMGQNFVNLYKRVLPYE